MSARALLLAALACAARAAAQEPAGPAPGRRVLGLEEAVRAAREHQPLLRSARARASVADARAAAARAPLLPQVSLEATLEEATRNWAPTPTSAPRRLYPPLSYDTRNYLALDASAKQLLWDFGRTSGRWAAARAAASAQEADADQSEVDAILAVRAAFFQARAAKDLVAVARAAVRNQDAHLAQIRGYVDVGSRPAIDLAQARMDRANLAVRVVQAENAYATAKARLDDAMGVEDPTDYDVSDESLAPVAGEDGPLDALVAEAARGRPGLAAAERRVESARRAAGSAAGGWWPSLGVFATGTDRGYSLPHARWNAAAGVTLAWRLFEGGLTRAEIDEARASLDAAIADRDVARRRVRLEVDEARLGVRAATAALGAAREAVDAARERLGLAEGRYETGAGSALELQDAQLSTTAAEAQQVLARYELAQARARLLAALGRGAP